MKTQVVNIRREKADVYIGRGSEWGNPFVIGRDGDRNAVLVKYADYMTTWDKEKLMRMIKQLHGKKLGCYCKPLACHGDLIVHLIEDLM